MNWKHIELGLYAKVKNCTVEWERPRILYGWHEARTSSAESAGERNQLYRTGMGQPASRDEGGTY